MFMLVIAQINITSWKLEIFTSSNVVKKSASAQMTKARFVSMKNTECTGGQAKRDYGVEKMHFEVQSLFDRLQ